MDALRVCLSAYAATCSVVWVASVVTREYSWVDRIWSLIPLVYVGIIAGAAGFDDARLNLMCVLVTLWGLRLTFNFARKGGYARGGEDYRWPALRARMTPAQFQVFNLVFITLSQNVVLLLITLPASTALQHRTAFGAWDVVLAVAFVAFLIGETVADQQQWVFQNRKRAEVEAGRETVRFLQSGLFRFSRHPNFFFEQAQWWVVAAFGVVAAGAVQWTVIGALSLTLLFVGSTRFTESISVSRYPEYAEYQRRTSAIVPWWPRRGGRAGTASAAPPSAPGPPPPDSRGREAGR